MGLLAAISLFHAFILWGRRQRIVTGKKHYRVGVWREEEETLLSPFSFLPPFSLRLFILIKYQQSKYQSTSDIHWLLKQIEQLVFFKCMFFGGENGIQESEKKMVRDAGFS